MPPDKMASQILYVEDDLIIQHLLETALTEAGYQVLTVSNGAEALDRLQTISSGLKALITDINLGGLIDGWEIGRHARGLAPILPVVYVSGGSEHEWTAEGVPHSVMIAKPFAPAQVVVAVSTLINSADAVAPLHAPFTSRSSAEVGQFSSVSAWSDAQNLFLGRELLKS